MKYLTRPTDSECAEYLAGTSFDEYLKSHACDWDAYACCFITDDSCGYRCPPRIDSRVVDALYLEAIEFLNVLTFTIFVLLALLITFLIKK